jgi:hypothetical protein
MSATRVHIPSWKEMAPRETHRSTVTGYRFALENSNQSLLIGGFLPSREQEAEKVARTLDKNVIEQILAWIFSKIHFRSFANPKPRITPFRRRFHDAVFKRLSRRTSYFLSGSKNDQCHYSYKYLVDRFWKFAHLFNINAPFRLPFPRL